MLYKSQFRVDIFRLKNERDEEGLLNHMKMRVAQEIGVELCKSIPFELNKEFSQRRELVDANSPSYLFGTESPHEQYDCEVFAVSRKDWQNFKKQLLALRDYRITQEDGSIKTIKDIIIELEAK